MRSLPPMSLANDYFSAVLSKQTIYLDDKAVDWTVYNILDQNYVRLGDLCPEIGVGLAWDPYANAVRMTSYGSTPIISEAPEVTESLHYYTPNSEGNSTSLPLPNFTSYFGAEETENMQGRANGWENTALFGIYSGYLNSDVTNCISEVISASIDNGSGTKVLFYENGTHVNQNAVIPVVEDSYCELTISYVLKDKSGHEINLDLGIVYEYYNNIPSYFLTKVNIHTDASQGYYYYASSYDGFGLLIKDTTRFSGGENSNWEFPAFNYFIKEMVTDYIKVEWDSEGNFIGWSYN